MGDKKLTYPCKIAFYSKENLKKALEDYSKKEGINPSVINRKALFEYLEKKGVLKKEDYL